MGGSYHAPPSVVLLRGLSWRPPKPLVMSTKPFIKGDWAFEALIIFSSLSTTKSRLPKQIVVLGAQTTSWLAIRILVKIALRTSKAPIWRDNCRCFKPARTSKFVCMCSGSEWCAQWVHDLYWFGQNVPTSSLPWLAVLTLCCPMLVVGVTSQQEREELPSLLCVVGCKDYEFGVRCLAKPWASLRCALRLCLRCPLSPRLSRPSPFYRPRRESVTGSFSWKESLRCGRTKRSTLVKS
jgi:hypothetical protein